MSGDADPENLLDLPGVDAPIAPGTAVAALAMNFALKYFDIAMVRDGVLYQQYKLEGRNMDTIHLDWVFDYAKRIELHLLGGSERIAGFVFDAILADAPPPKPKRGRKAKP